MSLGLLVLIITVAALLITLGVYFYKESMDSVFISFLQNFVGVLFIISGFVKAVDPLGTAFKMEEYFSEFEIAFQESWLSFLAPLFPALTAWSILFSVMVISLELIIGVMLVIGYKRKLTTWLFLLIVLFFTFLTGYTFLTGFVPGDSTFFHFTDWTEFDEKNMRVTDCGCFGDFLVLKPSISFLKDLFLLIPALILLFKWRQMHILFSPSTRTGLMVISIVMAIVYCLSNFAWSLPDLDFRPFREGTDLRSEKQNQNEIMNSVDITGFKMKNEAGEMKEVDYNEYMANYKALQEEGWTVIEQVKSEPEGELNKIADFYLEDPLEGDVTQEVLDRDGYQIWVISYEMKGQVIPYTKTVGDTIIVVDTLFVADDTLYDRYIQEIKLHDEELSRMKFTEDYAEDLEEMEKLLKQAHAEGVSTSYIISGLTPEIAVQLREDLETTADIYTADEILLKTMIRSNPGIMVMNDGKVIKKIHKSQLPDNFGELSNEEF